MELKVIIQDIKKLETDALIVNFFEDVRPLKGLAGELDWLLCGSLSHLILNNKINGSLGDVALLTSQGKIPAQKIFLLGLGPKAGVSPASLRSAARNAASSAIRAGVTRASLEFVPTSDVPHDTTIAALREGLREGSEGKNLDVLLITSDAATYEQISRLVKQ